MSEGMKRRDFLKVAGVTGAGAGLVGCSTDQVEQLIPYMVPPEEITPGVSTWYATACGECPAGCGVWVETREGRAIKVEGNPDHPVSGGALCSRGHSALQGVYDPDRLLQPMQRNGDSFEPVSWENAEAILAQGVRDAGSDVLFLGGREGPSLTGLQEDLAEALGGRRVGYEPLSEAPLREAARMAFGVDALPSYDFEAAGIIFSFGADFLQTWISPVEHERGFARSTGIGEELDKSRFVFVGPRLSLTGQNADEWIPVDPGAEGLVALAMAHVIAREGGDAGPYADLLETYAPAAVSATVGIPAEAIEELAQRFVSEGPGLAAGPGVSGQGRNATAVNLAVLVLNAVAGSVGVTVHPGRPHLSAATAGVAEVHQAIEDMVAGQIGAVVLLGTNPAYSLPAPAGLPPALENVGFTVAIADRMDETAQLADLVLPAAHFLESWGDQNAYPGVWSVQQPVMRPVPHFESRSVGDILLALGRQLEVDLGAETFHDYVRNRWSELHADAGSPDGTFDAFWRRALREGVVELPATEAPTELQAPDRALTFEPPELEGEGLALIVYPSPRLGDGRFANRPWLLELPDPVSKITWHSWVELHPETASELGVRNGDMVNLASPHGEVIVPVWTYPGIRRDVAALATGSGHAHFGRYADGMGVNAFTLLSGEAEQPSGAMIHLETRVRVEPTGEQRRLATVEGSSDQRDRPIAPAVELAALAAGADVEEEHHDPIHELQAVGGFVPVETEAEPESYPLPGAQHGSYDPETQARWAMAIDLDKCTGCSACVTACQSENNVPWVGEEQILMNRDLHWIRLERYYEEVNADEPGPVDIRFLPMLCQHCGNAPCEPVCPVYAAYHTPDGLNAQVYNRCVGTRYCANNCPYKVRVFNWFEYSDVPEPLNWQYNPDVTVRGEGIMEKCSFCVQRIRRSENRAALEGRGVRDGEIVPACQQSCPAEAIVFGNIRDPESRVSQVVQGERTYRVLDALINTQPAVNYLRKVTFHPVHDIHV